MDLYSLMDRLEHLAVASTRVPLTGKRMVNAEDLLEVLEQLRRAIPRDLEEAREVLGQREEILTQALTNANRAKVAGEHEARVRVSESEVVKSARRRADEIVASAEGRAAKLMQRVQSEMEQRRAGADAYAHDVLSNLEQDLATVLETVRRGLRVLAPSGEHGQLEVVPDEATAKPS